MTLQRWTKNEKRMKEKRMKEKSGKEKKRKEKKRKERKEKNQLFFLVNLKIVTHYKSIFRCDQAEKEKNKKHFPQLC